VALTKMVETVHRHDAKAAAPVIGQVPSAKPAPIRQSAA
jgi:hypothetical protein